MVPAVHKKIDAKKKTETQNVKEAEFASKTEKAVATEHLSAFFGNIRDNKIFVAPNIPAKKLTNALASYAHNVKTEDDERTWS